MTLYRLYVDHRSLIGDVSRFLRSQSTVSELASQKIMHFVITVALGPRRQGMLRHFTTERPFCRQDRKHRTGLRERMKRVCQG